jgi:hypothetical protein
MFWLYKLSRIIRGISTKCIKQTNTIVHIILSEKLKSRSLQCPSDN